MWQYYKSDQESKNNWEEKLQEDGNIAWIKLKKNGKAKDKIIQQILKK